MARAEVHENDAPASLAHDVLRLDVAVEKARVVHRAERLREVGGDGRDCVRIQSASLGQECSSVRPSMNSVQIPTESPIYSAPCTVSTFSMTDACEEARFVDRTRG